MRKILPVICLTVLALSGCTGNTTDAQNSSSSSSEALVTHNVTYSGLLEEAGPSVYQQGTHRLTLTDGRFILLTSVTADLDTYVGKRVEVTGSTQATVEAGGTIMAVEGIVVVDGSSSSSVSSFKMCGGIAGFACDAGTHCIDNPTDSCDPLNGGADCGGICVPDTSSASSAAVSSAAASSVMQSSAASSRSSAAAVSSAAPASSKPAVSSSASSVPAASADVEAKIVAMMKEDYSNSARWTQTYCTNHMGFCIPVHRNWYFRSFGATSSALWHVEFNNADFETINTGVIMLNVLAGTSAAAGGTSGQVSTNGSQSVGFFDWQNQHIEISGDARLKDAIGYMIMHITAAPVQ